MNGLGFLQRKLTPNTISLVATPAATSLTNLERANWVSGSHSGALQLFFWPELAPNVRGDLGIIACGLSALDWRLAVNTEAAEIDGIKAIIRKVWKLPADFPPEELTAFAKELRDRIRRGDMKEVLYVRASLVQTYEMRLPLTPTHGANRILIDQVYAFLDEKNSN